MSMSEPSSKLSIIRFVSESQALVGVEDLDNELARNIILKERQARGGTHNMTRRESPSTTLVLGGPIISDIEKTMTEVVSDGHRS